MRGYAGNENGVEMRRLRGAYNLLTEITIAYFNGFRPNIGWVCRMFDDFQ